MDSECLRNVRLSKNRFKNSYLSSTNFSSDSDSCHSSTRASILEEHADFSHENPLRTAKAFFVVSLRSSLLCFKFMKAILSRDVSCWWRWRLTGKGGGVGCGTHEAPNTFQEQRSLLVEKSIVHFLLLVWRKRTFSLIFPRVFKNAKNADLDAPWKRLFTKGDIQIRANLAVDNNLLLLLLLLLLSLYKKCSL